MGEHHQGLAHSHAHVHDSSADVVIPHLEVSFVDSRGICDRACTRMNSRASPLFFFFHASHAFQLTVPELQKLAVFLPSSRITSRSSSLLSTAQECSADLCTSATGKVFSMNSASTDSNEVAAPRYCKTRRLSAVIACLQFLRRSCYKGKPFSD